MKNIIVATSLFVLSTASFASCQSAYRACVKRSFSGSIQNYDTENEMRNKSDTLKAYAKRLIADAEEPFSFSTTGPGVWITGEGLFLSSFIEDITDKVTKTSVTSTRKLTSKKKAKNCAKVLKILKGAETGIGQTIYDFKDEVMDTMEIEEFTERVAEANKAKALCPDGQALKYDEFKLALVEFLY